MCKDEIENLKNQLHEMEANFIFQKARADLNEEDNRKLRAAAKWTDAGQIEQLKAEIDDLKRQLRKG